MLKSLILTLTFLVVALFVFTGSASADEGSGTLRHAYKPTTVAATQWTRARVDNFTAVQQKRLVCVEAFNNATNAKTHLGCLWVNLAPMGSTVSDWAFEFDVPTNMLSPGSYNVVYTYQADDGSWHQIKSVNLQTQVGQFVS